MYLSRHEKLLILAALRTVAPSGGGSGPFSLAMKLHGEWGIPMDNEEEQRLITVFSNTVVEEWKEATS